MNLVKKIGLQSFYTPSALHGEAIDYVYEKEDGTMWIGNLEYESRVNFCPMTGKPAKKQMSFIQSENSDFKEYIP